MTPSSRPGLLLFLSVECHQAYAADLDDLETTTGQISHSMTTSPEPRNKNFVIFFDEVETTITRDECANLFAVFDQLDTDTL